MLLLCFSWFFHFTNLEEENPPQSPAAYDIFSSICVRVHQMHFNHHSQPADLQKTW